MAASISGESITMLGISAILLSGFLFTRLTKFARLPNVSGFILAGVIIGPSVLNLVPGALIEGMGFISDVALSFISFGAARYLTRDKLRAVGRRVLLVSLAECLLSGLIAFAVTRFWMRLSLDVSLLLSAIAVATAPASTMATIRERKARGAFVSVLITVMAIDNAACMLLFGISASAIGAMSMWLTCLLDAASIATGIACGLLLAHLISPRRSGDNRLILGVAFIVLAAGACAAMNVSPIMSCMAMGAVYVNRSGDKTLFKRLEKFTPPITSLFFILSGMRLNVEALSSFALIGGAYFCARLAGKYLGARLGAKIAGMDKAVVDYLGLALAPQAGVAIGLAFLGQRLLPGETGDTLLTIILASSVLGEMIGPACAKLALVKSGAIRQLRAPSATSLNERL